MTQKTKLEIIGPYTPEHKGPFCTRNGLPVRIICTDRKGTSPIIGLVQDGSMELLVAAEPDGGAVTMNRKYDIMNAREVPVAREFWVNEYAGKDGLFHNIFENEATAHRHEADTFLRTIHVREVLLGEK